jgi:hypothetical protein
MIIEARTNLKGFQDKLEDVVARLEAEEKSPGYINNLVKIMRNWLRYNDILLTRRVKIKNSTACPTIANEQIPSREELAKLFRNSSGRMRVAEAPMALADLRPETIRNHNGSDGLRLGDLPEVKGENGQVSFDKVPTVVIVRSSLSKAKHRYFTFLPEEGTRYLQEYFEQRIRDGERLHANSPVVGQERTDLAKNVD